MLPFRILGIATAIVLAGCATAPAPGQAPTAQAQPAEQDKVVCVREAPTGNRMLQTRCYTMKSLEQRSRDDRNAADSIQTRPHDRLVGGGS